MTSFLVHGTLSPSVSDTHVGVFLRKNDITSLAKSGACINKPVRIEHGNTDVGVVISAWEHDGKLDCVFKLNNDSIESLLARGFVQSGCCPELSLGYSVVMENSEQGLTGGYKEVNEISIVKKGARHSCHIHGFKK